MSEIDEETVERVARALYELNPVEEGGEYVDSFMVSPGGALSWEQAKARDDEFAPKYMTSITDPFYRDARAAIAAMPSWRPIESAPKDGTNILLYAGPQTYQGKPVEPRLTYGCWLILEHGKYVGDCGGECRCPEYDEPPEPYWYSEDGGFTPENPPTHWRPLPAPPKPEGGQT